MKEISLTYREYQIYQLLVSGFTNGEISSQLLIRENTVRKHIKRVYSKIYIAMGDDGKHKFTRRQAIVFGLQAGIPVASPTLYRFVVDGGRKDCYTLEHDLITHSSE